MLLLSELKVKSESKYFGLAKCGTLQSESTSFKGAIGRLLLEQRGTTTRWTNVNGDIKIPSILLLLPSLTQPPRSSGPAEKRQSISCRPTAGRNPLVTDTMHHFASHEFVCVLILLSQCAIVYSNVCIKGVINDDQENKKDINLWQCNDQKDFITDEMTQ